MIIPLDLHKRGEGGEGGAAASWEVEEREEDAGKPILHIRSG